MASTSIHVTTYNVRVCTGLEVVRYFFL